MFWVAGTCQICPIHLATKYLKCIEINLTKDVRSLHTKNNSSRDKSKTRKGVAIKLSSFWTQWRVIKMKRQSTEWEKTSADNKHLHLTKDSYREYRSSRKYHHEQWGKARNRHFQSLKYNQLMSLLTDA